MGRTQKRAEGIRMPIGSESLGKALMTVGAILLIVGILIHFGGKVFNLGRLPGDIQYESGNIGFYFPVVSSIIISVVLTIILNIFFKR